tara:strand:+ start:918 stop:1109 length:192 start_codon:yes stop_codon:yes gene_type:complete
MNRSSGEILEAAMIEPVVLTKHGKESNMFSLPAFITACAASRARRSPICFMKPTIFMRSLWRE